MSRSSPARKKPAVARSTRPRLTAKTADKHALYEASVQDTANDIAFITRVYRATHGHVPERLREDFCGTAKLCADWVASRPTRHAWGLDLHGPTLRYGRRRHIAPLGDAASRVTLLQRNVLDGGDQAVDVAVAFNFSYCIFKAREQMLAYFRGVHRGLDRRGIFFLDIHGGTECFEELEEQTRHKGFTYVWDQEPYDAIGGLAVRHIHFRFPDGTMMRRAYTYDWRLWNLPELTDILTEAGFKQVDIYWEGAEADGSGNGVFRKRKRADNEQAWIAYIVAHKAHNGHKERR